MIRALLGAKAQVVIGALCFLVGIVFWAYIEIVYRPELTKDPLVASIFRVSMFFGLVACYAIVATGAGYRATERVEEVVTSGDVDVEHADEVNVRGGS